MNSKEDIQKALLSAIKVNDLDAVKRCVEQGADVNAEAEDEHQCVRMPLHFAAVYNRMEVVKYLVSQGASVNAKGKFGWTPLLYAADGWNAEVVRFLVSNGADVNAKDNDGATPLHYAAMNSSKTSDFYTAIDDYCREKASKQTFLDKCLTWLDHFFHGSAPTAYVGTFTTDSLPGDFSNIEMMTILCEHGADINARDNEGKTPLDYDEHNCCGKDTVFLLDRGAKKREELET